MSRTPNRRAISRVVGLSWLAGNPSSRDVPPAAMNGERPSAMRVRPMPVTASSRIVMTHSSHLRAPRPVTADAKRVTYGGFSGAVRESAAARVATARIARIHRRLGAITRHHELHHALGVAGH